MSTTRQTIVGAITDGLRVAMKDDDNVVLLGGDDVAPGAFANVHGVSRHADLRQRCCGDQN